MFDYFKEQTAKQARRMTSIWNDEITRLIPRMKTTFKQYFIKRACAHLFICWQFLVVFSFRINKFFLIDKDVIERNAEHSLSHFRQLQFQTPDALDIYFAYALTTYGET